MIAFLIGETYNIRIGDNWRPKTTCQSLTLSSLGGDRPLAPPMDPPLNTTYPLHLNYATTLGHIFPKWRHPLF